MAASDVPERPTDPSGERRRVERCCPDLAGQRYHLHSKSSKRYNCVAWANQDCRRYWSPRRGYYWPVPRDESTPDIATVEILEAWFRTQGFVDCDSVDPSARVERVAIYGDVLSALHVARQPAHGGGWLSKMGDGPDIEHEELGWIEGPSAGRVQLIVCRVVGEPEPIRLSMP
jgi:hypothetical protein